MERVRALGCVCCLLSGSRDVPASVHHIRKGVGKGVRNHRWTIPLCPYHHQDGPPGQAVHAGEKVWKWDEIVLLHLVQELLARQTHTTGAHDP